MDGKIFADGSWDWLLGVGCGLVGPLSPATD
jgi:hypothetical protein